MKILITQSNYIPWKGYFDAINSADICVLYDEMQYTKRDWRNRNKIKNPNGTQWLTIPVDVKGKYYQKINEAQVNNTNWGSEHWKAIAYNYKKTPFFEEISTWLRPLYQTDLKYLSEINYLFIQAICDYLDIKTSIRWSSEFNLRGDKTEKLLNICLDLKASCYYSGPAAKNYLDTTLFQHHNIEIEWLDYAHYPEYPQLFLPFEHGVSIIDLLFNKGKDSIEYMKSFDTIKL